MDQYWTSQDCSQTPDGPKPEHIKVLLSKFGHRSFRSMQWQIIHSVMVQKRDTCAFLPTGYGKSVCYQFPSVYNGGVTLVVSPLISLMEDQVAALLEKNIPACLLGSANRARSETTDGILRGEYSLVYLTPEFCTGEAGEEILGNMASALTVNLIAIDEAHCISAWGQDFRCSYKKLGVLKDMFPGIPVLAVTATATSKVREDIVKSLRLRNANALSMGFDRPNLYFQVFPKGATVLGDLHNLMACSEKTYTFSGPTIIYTLTKESADRISDALQGRGINSASYHAGLPLRERREAHEKFTRGEVDVVVATVAFGMGIDKADVRQVVHYGCPESIERYYQEAGRAGRDGMPATCTLFYDEDDFRIHKFFRLKLKGHYYKVKDEMMECMKNYITTKECRRKFILKYFEDDSEPVHSHCCDNCKNGSNQVDATLYEEVENKKHDVSEDVRKFLSVFTVIKYPFGLTAFVEFVRGYRPKKLSRYFGNRVHGCGKEKDDKWWKEIANICFRHKFLTKKLESGGGFSYEGVKISRTGEKFLANPHKLLEELPADLLKLTTNIWLRKVKPESSGGQTENQEVHARESGFPMQIFQLLKTRRNELSWKYNWPALSVASDQALLKVAIEKPVTLDQLAKCHSDFTSEKVDRYGEEFLAIIRKSLAKTSIKDVLREHPLPVNSVLTQTQWEVFSLLQKGLPVDKIAQDRKLPVEVVSMHLNQCLENGLPIKLRDLGVSDDVRRRITGMVEKGPLTIDSVRSAFPDLTPSDISYVLTYLRVREHLAGLGIPYEEYEDFEKPVEEKRDKLADFIDALLEAQEDDDLTQVVTGAHEEGDDETDVEVFEISDDDGEPDFKKVKADSEDSKQVVGVGSEGLSVSSEGTKEKACLDQIIFIKDEVSEAACPVDDNSVKARDKTCKNNLLERSSFVDDFEDILLQMEMKKPGNAEVFSVLDSP